MDVSQDFLSQAIFVWNNFYNLENDFEGDYFDSSMISTLSKNRLTGISEVLVS